MKKTLAAALTALLVAAPAAGASSVETSSASVPAWFGGDFVTGWLGQGLFQGSSEAVGSSVSTDGSSRNEPGLTLPGPVGPDGTGASLVEEPVHLAGDLYEIQVHSPAMGQVITNEVLLPGGLDDTEPRPTFYLMMGADGAAGGWTWADASDYEEFFADKHVNVVTPVGSVSSMQTDWYSDDPVLGANKWATYMTQELPEVMDGHFHGTGRDGIAGISMSGGPALDLATIAPGRFVAAGSYSGCPATEGLFGYLYVRTAVEMNGGDAHEMWGPPFDDAWAAHNPAAKFDLLRGMALYVGASHGNHGPIDDGLPGNAAIETASFVCSAHFVDQALDHNVAVDWDPRTAGTHSWGLFEDQLRTSWRTIGPALGVE